MYVCAICKYLKTKLALVHGRGCEKHAYVQNAATAATPTFLHSSSDRAVCSVTFLETLAGQSTTCAAVKVLWLELGSWSKVVI